LLGIFILIGVIKLQDIISGKLEDRSRPPRGYKITTPVVSKEGGYNWYDCMVWKDGRVILSTSMTMFDIKSKAYEIGVRRAWDIHDGKEDWS